MTRTKNFKVLAVLASVAAALAASLLVLSLFEKPAQAQASEAPDIEVQIIGGTDVPDGKYPFLVALLDKSAGSTAFQQQFCGGTLIDSDSVLTAAHCVRSKAASNLRVAAGRTVLNSDQGQVRDVAKIESHPSYNPSTQANDVAVIELSTPVSSIQPVKLATAAQDSTLEEPGSNATVAGWGNTIAQPPGGDAGNSFPQRMREAQVPIVSDTTADGIYSSYEPPLMVAAGRTGKDTCQGDSGGPLFASMPGEGYTQVGVTSFGIGCGAAGFPGVYAEVNNQNIRNFITSSADSGGGGGGGGGDGGDGGGDGDGGGHSEKWFKKRINELQHKLHDTTDAGNRRHIKQAINELQKKKKK